MNYYERHLGDYTKATAHLSMVEHGAYGLLLDRYYITEDGIPADQAHRIARARSPQERSAVDAVLAEFFSLVDGVWRHDRCDAEIAKAQTKIEAARKNGARGGRPKRTDEKPTGFPLGCDLVTQTKALQSPDPNTNTKTPPPPDGGSDPAGFAEFWDSWPQSPRKVARKQCSAKWKRHGLKSQLPAILAHVEAMKHSKQWRDGYEPAPLTYLNQERWGDGLPVEAETQTESGYL